jgi:hypothetical protein
MSETSFAVPMGVARYAESICSRHGWSRCTSRPLCQAQPALDDLADDGPAASAEDLDEQHPCVHHCDQQAQQDAGDQPVEPAAHPKHQRHSAD